MKKKRKRNHIIVKPIYFLFHPANFILSPMFRNVEPVKSIKYKFKCVKQDQQNA